MTHVFTICSKCGGRFDWDLDSPRGQPDCPMCGFNFKHQFEQAGNTQLYDWLAQGDEHERSYAAAELGNRRDASAVDVLVGMLDDPSAGLAACIALGKIRDRRAVKPLLKALRENLPGTAPPSALAKSICQCGGRDELVDALDSMPERVLADAVEALAENRGYHNTLYPLLLRKSKSLKELALDSIKRMKWTPPTAEDAALYAVMSGEGKVLARWEKKAELLMVEFLEQGDPAMVTGVIDLMQRGHWRPSDPGFYIPLLRQKNRRAAAAAVLQYLDWEPEAAGDKAVFFVLTEQWSRLQALGEPARDMVFSLLSSPDRDFRIAAMAAVNACDWPAPTSKELTRVASLLSSRDLKLQEGAAQWLVNTGRFDARLAVLKSGVALADTLVDGWPAPAGNELAQLPPLLQHADPKAREHAAQWMLRSGRAEALAAVIKADVPLEIRRDALARLKKSDAENKNAVLLGLVSDAQLQANGMEFCEACALMLAKLGDQRAVAPLIELVEAHPTALGAIVALGQLGDPEAVPALTRVMKVIKRDEKIREAAAQSLQAITGKRPRRGFWGWG